MRCTIGAVVGSGSRRLSVAPRRAFSALGCSRIGRVDTHTAVVHRGVAHDGRQRPARRPTGHPADHDGDRARRRKHDLHPTTLTRPPPPPPPRSRLRSTNAAPCSHGPPATPTSASGTRASSWRPRWPATSLTRPRSGSRCRARPRRCVRCRRAPRSTGSGPLSRPATACGYGARTSRGGHARCPIGLHGEPHVRTRIEPGRSSHCVHPGMATRPSARPTPPAVQRTRTRRAQSGTTITITCPPRTPGPRMRS